MSVMPTEDPKVVDPKEVEKPEEESEWKFPKSVEMEDLLGQLIDPSWY